MKSKKLNAKLKLNKLSISHLQKEQTKGGTDWPDTHRGCPSLACPTQWPTCQAGCDFPTINDSCFSLCRTICNDY
ncbi:class I lanthipeptide [uncultured Kordia sp.]|uniref:class I lanthipeptide n=1 Tax=uncultured Kordia sp. TaxID=507699 RepID=UPI0026107743|nr:class I lanthipeptide [uncultured Kordia sp.]